MASSCEYGNEPTDSVKWGGISWQAQEVLAPQEGLCSVAVVVVRMYYIGGLQVLNICEIFASPRLF
jgi:hypothetical protein